jgi:hypothetical protein
VAIGVASPAAAEPCTGPAANAIPPADAATPTPSLPSSGPPVGHRPPNTNDNAGLPRLGRLPLAVLNALSPQEQLRQQAGVMPQPAPPAAPAQPTPNGAAAEPAPAAAPAPPVAPGTTSLVGWVTGPESPTNTLKNFAISGTDLGIMWDNGDPANNQVLIAFGDTYGYCGVRGQQWRYNTLFRSQDRALSGGIDVKTGANGTYGGSPLRQPSVSKQVVNSIGWAGKEVGIIPTAGIAVGKTQFMNIMSIRNWDNPGGWSTNFSAIAMSPDNGQNWGVYPGTVRAAGPEGTANVAYVRGNENFQQGAFVKSGDGYVYSFGTPAGRSGAAFVSRVPQARVPDLTAYQYWNSDQNAWVPTNPGAATPVIPGPVGEMSVQYNTYLKKYLVLYCNGANDVVARTAPAPQGPWSGEQMLVRSSEIPGGIYAPFLHPWSTGQDLYFNLSLWSAYNVMLMHTALP